MSILEVKNLCKKYPSFDLKDVSFSLEEGKITGFVGRNGAGKSTTLSCLFNFVHPDSGEIEFFSKPLLSNESFIKENVGYVSGGVNFYMKKKLKKITAVTKSFYHSWDEAAYEKYMRLFALDENKTPYSLSQGMKTKYALALALSHGAKLLILDEPTSGLDPVSRDELLDIFMALSDEGKTILFSTHIISDLEKCADNIIYIKNGEIAADASVKSFEDEYKLVSCADEEFLKEHSSVLIGKRRTKNGYTSLIKARDAEKSGIEAFDSSLEEIMLHMEKDI
ncbi:MAG: ABC transporter ATP-binding protein [Acutalibacteraceae bacterium]